jgi:lipopolysaccharide export system protein LptA
VVITTSSGAKLITDSLDWDRQKELVTTKDKVNIARQNMYATALGAMGQPSLSRVTLKKEVQVDINQEPPKDKPDSEGTKTTITCDGPLEIDYTKSVATFRNNVLVVTQGNQIYSDAMDVYFMPSAKTQEAEEAKKARMEEAEASLEKIVARGNVKIVKGENVSYSDEAIYTVADKKILLTGRPKLVIYQTEKLDASAGN